MSRISFKKSNVLIKKWGFPRIFGNGVIANLIKDKSIFTKTATKSPLLCLNPMFAFWFRTNYEKAPKLKCKRTLLKYSDGGEASIDKMLDANEINSDNDFIDLETPIILVFPGANESTWATKVLTLSSSYLKHGFNDIFICNYRGRCKTPLTTAQFSFPFGRFNDVQYSVDYIKDNFPNRKILLVGSCFGAQCIVDYLTCQSDKVPHNVVGAVVHSVQWNACEASSLLMKEPIYSRFMKPWATYTKDILIKQFSQEISKKIGLDNFSTFSSLSFDRYTDINTMYKTGIGRFIVDDLVNDHNDYATLSSPHLKISKFPVVKPLIIINSIDDPTAPITMQEINEIEKDPNICLSLLSCGGHCAFVRSMLPTTNFIDDIMIECSNIIVHHTIRKP